MDAATSRRYRKRRKAEISDRRKAKYAANLEKARISAREYYAANKEHAAAYARERRSKYREHYAARRRFETHGITHDEFCEMWNLQAGRCAICAVRMVLASMSEGRAQTACVDHDHTTGAIRGLLCSACNRGLGLLRDSSVLLSSALRYLSGSTR